MADKDIKHGWKNVARRGQSVSKSRGLSIVTLTVLVNQDGDAILWLAPDVKKIEPRASARQILEEIAKAKGGIVESPLT